LLSATDLMVEKCLFMFLASLLGTSTLKVSKVRQSRWTRWVVANNEHHCLPLGLLPSGIDGIIVVSSLHTCCMVQQSNCWVKAICMIQSMTRKSHRWLDKLISKSWACEKNTQSLLGLFGYFSFWYFSRKPQFKYPNDIAIVCDSVFFI
jgi:hypothetical protein